LFCFVIAVWIIVGFSILGKYYEKYGTLSTELVLTQTFTFLYVFDYFFFEICMTTTWDIIAERFGYMLVVSDAPPFLFLRFSLFFEMQRKYEKKQKKAISSNSRFRSLVGSVLLLSLLLQHPIVLFAGCAPNGTPPSLGLRSHYSHLCDWILHLPNVTAFASTFHFFLTFFFFPFLSFPSFADRISKNTTSSS
jgi:hypothetical protein